MSSSLSSHHVRSTLASLNAVPSCCSCTTRAREQEVADTGRIALSVMGL